MKDKNVKSFGEFNESVFSDQGHAGMNGERYIDKTTFSLEDMEKCWMASRRKEFDTGLPVYSTFEDWFDMKFKNS